MPHRSRHADPKVSIASVQEFTPQEHASAKEIVSKKGYGKAKGHHGARAPHERQSDIRGAIHQAPSPKPSGHLLSSHGAHAASHGQAPPATSIVGSMSIIESPRKGKDHNLGIPGIISSTSLGPEQRQRLVGGIIESPIHGPESASGPVHAIMGHDSTAYNEGMVHIRGSHFK